jgi:hypothetical protein
MQEKVPRHGTRCCPRFALEVTARIFPTRGWLSRRRPGGDQHIFDAMAISRSRSSCRSCARLVPVMSRATSEPATISERSPCVARRDQDRLGDRRLFSRSGIRIRCCRSIQRQASRGKIDWSRGHDGFADRTRQPPLAPCDVCSSARKGPVHSIDRIALPRLAYRFATRC